MSTALSKDKVELLGKKIKCKVHQHENGLPIIHDTSLTVPWVAVAQWQILRKTDFITTSFFHIFHMNITALNDLNNIHSVSV